MVEWQKYKKMGRICQLKNEGRELIGEEIFWTEKRDGSNISFWTNDEGYVQFSSHNLENITDDTLKNNVICAPEYEELVLLAVEEPNKIFYCEYIYRGKTPTRTEPPHKHPHLVLIDAYCTIDKRWLSYNWVHQMAVQRKIPIVRLLDIQTPRNMEELFDTRDSLLTWCKRHRREGVVGKTYSKTPQIFFKEKRDLPQRPRKFKPKENEIQLPMMPDDKIISAIEQAKYEVEKNDGNFKNPKDAMPVVAKYITTEAREHDYEVPGQMFKLYQLYLEGKYANT